MCQKVYVEEFSNIIMFLTHLSKEPFIIQELLRNSKSIFNETPILRLDNDVMGINKLVKEIPKQVIELASAKEVRDEELAERDEIEILQKEYDEDKHKEISLDTYDDYDNINIISKMTMAIKTIEILGQLTKKYWGEMTGEEKYSILSEVYFLGLRTLNNYLLFVQDNTDSLVELIKDVVISKPVKNKLSLQKKAEDTASEYIFRLCFLSSFGIIKKITHAISFEKLSITFDSILEKNDINSVQLIDLSLKLDYTNQLPFDKISDIKDNLSKNFLGMLVLRNLIIDYLYLYNVDYKDKQRICQMLGIEMSDQRYIDATSHVKKR